MNKLKFFILILPLALCLLPLTLPVLAADATSAAEIEKSLQERIKKAIQDNLPSAQQDVADKTQNGQFKAFVGTIESISGKTIIIKTVNGTKQAIVSETTILVNNGKTGAKFTDLPINNAIIAIGQTTDLQTQNSVKVIVNPVPLTAKRLISSATVTKVNPKTKTINLEGLVFESNSDITISSKVQVFSSTLKILTVSDIKADQKIIAVVHDDDDELVLTRLIITASCGDKVCSAPETPETCPQDCQN